MRTLNERSGSSETARLPLASSLGVFPWRLPLASSLGGNVANGQRRDRPGHLNVVNDPGLPRTKLNLAIVRTKPPLSAHTLVRQTHDEVTDPPDPNPTSVSTPPPAAHTKQHSASLGARLSCTRA